jgi:hypothetical protein
LCPSWFSWTLLMAYSKAKLKSSGDKHYISLRNCFAGLLNNRNVITQNTMRYKILSIRPFTGADSPGWTLGLPFRGFLITQHTDTR